MLSERAGLQRVLVDGERSYVLTGLIGPVSLGDRVVVNTTAVELGDKATAERQLKDVASSRNSDLAALAKMALAAFYGNNNRTKEAVDLYQQLSNKPTNTVSKVMAQMQLASLYETSQQPMEAKHVYEQIVKENPKSEVESVAQARLQSLK